MPEVVADVLLGDRPVGLLHFANEFTRFEYSDLTPTHPILGQVFEDDPGRPRSARVEVPAWFANLLPELDSPLRSMIAAQAGVKAVRSFPLLVRLGDDLPGAVRVRLRLGDLDGERFAEEQEAASSAQDGTPLRFSLAGVQLKFSMVRTDRGLTLPVTGEGGNWLVKLPDRRYPKVPENEFTMLRWMSLVGIEVASAELRVGADLENLPRGLVGRDEAVLAVSRFDRGASGRVHMEDLAQVADVHPRDKYKGASFDNIGRLLAALCPDDVPEYLRRLTAMVAMGNTDAHLKNWTLLYRDPRRAGLAPAYDFVCITAYEDFAATGPSFRLGGIDQFPAVTRDAFRRLADRIGFAAERAVEVVDETVDALHAAWPELRQDGPAAAEVLQHVSDRLRELPLMRGK